MIVPVIGVAVIFVPTNAGTFPVPPAARPIAVLEFVHVNVPPAGVVAKADAGIVAPEQTVIFVIGLTIGFGFTVMVNVNGVPGQGLPAIVGVTVIVEVMGELVALVAVNVGKPPVPLATRPIAVLEFVQVYVAPAGVLAKVFAGTAVPEQYVRFGSGLTTGLGCTSTTSGKDKGAKHALIGVPVMV